MKKYDRDRLLKAAISDTECNCFTCRQERVSREVSKYMKDQLDADFIPRWAQTEAHHFRISPLYTRDLYRGWEKICKYLENLGKEKKEETSDRRCEDCGHYERASKLKQIKTHFVTGETETFTVCERCYSNYCTCSHCGESTPKVQPVWREFKFRGETYCHNCYIEHCGRCSVCGEDFYRKDMIDFNELTEIEPTVPPRLGELGLQFRAPRRERELLICKPCLKEHSMKCHQCGTLMLKQNSYSSEISGRRICNDCYTLATNYIQNYNYKPKTFPKLVASYEKPACADTLLFGVEVEMEPTSEKYMVDEEERYKFANIFIEHFGRDKILVKHDGTVRYGIEVVSFPFSWGWLKENAKLWESFFNLMSANHLTAMDGVTGGAGFHVHLTKKAFTTFHLYKFLNFLYTESPVQSKFLKIISGRTRNWQYARFHEVDGGKNLPKVAKCKYNMSRERHSAVSLMYTPTVEVRIFGGTDYYKIFMKNMEFCKSLFEFTRDTAKSKVNLAQYAMYLSDRNTGNKYPNLINFLTRSSAFENQCVGAYKLLTGNRR